MNWKPRLPRRVVALGYLMTVACGVALMSTDSALAASRVNAMPDRQVRPGATIPVWGNAGNAGAVGNGSANGEAYTWSFAPNANVAVTDDGNLTGTVIDDRFIAENVSFTLMNGSTREIITATLTVGPPVGATSKSVKIDIVDPNNAISDTPLEKLKVDVNIAIEDGKRAMYLAQQGNGRWIHTYAGYGSIGDCAATAFTVWAFANSGHQPVNNPNTDIYAEWVQKGIDFILSQTATQGVVAQPVIGSPDGDGNGRILSLCGGSFSSPVGYANPIATAAILAAYAPTPGNMGAPDTLVAAAFAGKVAGDTYRKVVQDAIDWIAFAQDDGASGQGGWRYYANWGDADTSVDSWHYVALEGFEVVFGGTVPELVKREAERRLNESQSQAAPVGRCGYLGPAPAGFDGNATTAGCLSGLVMISRGPRTAFHLDPGGSLVSGVFPDVASRKTAAVSHLGLRWDAPVGTWAGNRGNHYAMWTEARALRLLAGPPPNLPVPLVNGGVTFDWETGEENGSGNVPGPGATREGHFPFLVRTQLGTGAWATTGCCSWWDTTLNTALAILILQPTVFGPPPPIGPTCNGKAATIFVKDGIIQAPVGHEQKDQPFAGVLHGTNGNDVIVGTDGNDIIKGFDGNDTICGLGGNDTIQGGPGHDWIDGGDGNDLIKGQEGNDIIFGGAGNDFIEGGPGDDFIDGGAGNDDIAGQDGNDTLCGGTSSGTGKNFIDGGPGNNVIATGPGTNDIKGPHVPVATCPPPPLHTP